MYCTTREAGYDVGPRVEAGHTVLPLSLIHISEPTRPERISYAVFCLKKKRFKIMFTALGSTSHKTFYICMQNEQKLAI